MGTYIMLAGVAVMLLYSLCNWFILQLPNVVAIPILLVSIALVLVGAVWGKPWKEAVITLAICVAIGLLGALLTWRFLK
jgi:hypothetical protein